MDYTLSETKEKINQFADKMGSDYFPLPKILNYFQTAAYDFIGERLKYVESTQEITDDIRPLIVSKRIIVIDVTETFPGAPNPPGLAKKYAAAVPADYLRTIAYDVIYENGDRCRRADLMTQAEYRIALTNPNKKPTKHYPIILQESNLFQIDAGLTVASQLFLTYCKIPTIATTGEPSQRIINLPNDAIEKILLHTLTMMYGGTGDERVQINNQIQESFRKVFK